MSGAVGRRRVRLEAGQLHARLHRQRRRRRPAAAGEAETVLLRRVVVQMRIEDVDEKEGRGARILVEQLERAVDRRVRAADLPVVGMPVIVDLEPAIHVELRADEGGIGDRQRAVAGRTEDVGRRCQAGADRADGGALAHCTMDRRPGAGQERGDRRRRPPGGREGVGEARPLGREGVHRRRRLGRIAVAAKRIGAHRIDQDHDHVLGRLAAAAASEQEGERAQHGEREPGIPAERRSRTPAERARKLHRRMPFRAGAAPAHALCHCEALRPA